MNRAWHIAAWGLALLMALPLLVLVIRSFSGDGETWQHLQSTVLSRYIWNTLLLLLGTGLLSLIFGLSTAWIVSAYTFPGRRFFSWALVLPLSIPTYIAAFAYAGLFDFTGPIQRFTRHTLGWQTDALVPFDIMSMPGAILVISLVLFPYVYLISRASFMHQAGNLLEASRLLGRGSITTFFRVALPAARPAVVGGVSLVIMEMLNDYGAVKYYGVSTFTTGIFRAWFSLGDLTAAVRLSLCLLSLVLLLLALERWQRGRQAYQSTSKSRPLRPQRIRGSRMVLAWSICLLPFLLGFVLPVTQLINWSTDGLSGFDWSEFSQTIWNTAKVAAIVAVLGVLVALVLGYAGQLGGRSPWLQRLATIGYTIPGAVIAVGVMIPVQWLDDWVSFFLMGTIFALVYAALVRFLAVAYNAIDSGFTKIGRPLQEASTMLGASTWRSLWRVQLPLLRPALLAGFMLVFIDVLKELPLTLIMRPFNYDTLATKAFELASDEQLDVSAIYALMIIALGLVPIIFLNRLMKK